MKKYLGLALALCLSVSSVFAASEFGNAFKNAVKSDLNAVKEAAKQDVAAKKQAATAQKQAQNKAKKNEIEKKRAEQLKPIEAEIKEKQQLIKQTNNDKTLLQTQKTIRIRTYERQLESLNTRKANINKIYNAQLKAIGY